MGASNGDSDSALGKLLKSLDNRIALLLMAALLGVGGNQILVRAHPDAVRPDPFTGTQGAQLREDIVQLSSTLHAHLVRGEAGFQRIRELERRVSELEKRGR